MKPNLIPMLSCECCGDWYKANEMKQYTRNEIERVTLCPICFLSRTADNEPCDPAIHNLLKNVIEEI